MTDSAKRARGRLGALVAVGAAGLAVVCCAAGPLIVGVVAGAGVGGLIGGLGGALLVSALVAAAVLIARARSRRGVCGPGSCRVPTSLGVTRIRFAGGSGLPWFKRTPKEGRSAPSFCRSRRR